MNNFTPMTSNIRGQMSSNVNTINSLQQSFTPNRQLIPPTDYKNNGQILHNNLNDKIQAEGLEEYNITIDSSDRNYKSQPSLFNFTTSFGNVNYEPNIKRNFRNVKYVTLNYVLLPRTMCINTTNAYPNCEPPIPVPSTYKDILPSAVSRCCQQDLDKYLKSNLDHHPFLIVKIKELETHKSIASSSLLDENTFMIIPDRRLRDMEIWKPLRSTVSYKNSLLHNFDKLTLTVMDENGKELSLYDEDGKDIIRCSLGNRIQMNYNEYVNENKNYNKSVFYTDTVTRVIYNFSFGVIENEMSTSINFS
jgi:hypothetical protein